MFHPGHTVSPNRLSLTSTFPSSNNPFIKYPRHRQHHSLMLSLCKYISHSVIHDIMHSVSFHLPQSVIHHTQGVWLWSHLAAAGDMIECSGHVAHETFPIGVTPVQNPLAVWQGLRARESIWWLMSLKTEVRRMCKEVCTGREYYRVVLRSSDYEVSCNVIELSRAGDLCTPKSLMGARSYHITTDNL